jgi:hypothetical protein
MLECTPQIHCGLQHHYRRSSNTPPLHGVLEGSCIEVKAVEDCSPVCGQDNCLHSNRYSNPLLRHTRPFY